MATVICQLALMGCVCCKCCGGCCCPAGGRRIQKRQRFPALRDTASCVDVYQLSAARRHAPKRSRLPPQPEVMRANRESQRDLLAWMEQRRSLSGSSTSLQRYSRVSAERRIEFFEATSSSAMRYEQQQRYSAATAAGSTQSLFTRPTFEGPDDADQDRLPAFPEVVPIACSGPGANWICTCPYGRSQSQSSSTATLKAVPDPSGLYAELVEVRRAKMRAESSETDGETRANSCESGHHHHEGGGQLRSILKGTSSTTTTTTTTVVTKETRTKKRSKSKHR